MLHKLYPLSKFFDTGKETRVFQGKNHLEPNLRYYIKENSPHRNYMTNIDTELEIFDTGGSH